MTVSCFVPNCDSNSSRKIPGLSFHEFPSDIYLRDRWIRTVGKRDPITNEHRMPGAKSVICSLHFMPECFISSSKRRCLKKQSVPTIFFQHPPKVRRKRKKNSVISAEEQQLKWSALIAAACSCKPIEASLDEPTVIASITLPNVETSTNGHSQETSNELTVMDSTGEELDPEFNLDGAVAVILVQRS